MDEEDTSFYDAVAALADMESELDEFPALIIRETAHRVWVNVQPLREWLMELNASISSAHWSDARRECRKFRAYFKRAARSVDNQLHQVRPHLSCNDPVLLDLMSLDVVLSYYWDDRHLRDVCGALDKRVPELMMSESEPSDNEADEADEVAQS
ncbi:hypothetical protein HK097_010189 [Rhizophlyctis rosea]|uniref:Uncharacterized protein n=1 Tax=Rhizophlyctis rosea TaxID=64517 RepID=A0AAD5X3B3_9FUNG|nr:hypothetical protein HK097_010189 [Rhizophlyctis rosea]